MALEHNGYDQVVVGWPVYTPDGTEIGQVKEIRGRYFKVDAPMRPDYWLTADCVRTASGNQVLLDVDKDHLDDYKVDGPDDEDRGDCDHRGYKASGVTPTTRDNHTGREGAEFMDQGPAGTDPNYVPGVRMAQAMPGDTWQQAMPEYRQRWQERAGGAGRWEDIEPGYRYGYEMAASPRYQGRTWADAEADLAAGYGEWCLESGYEQDERAWERMREATRDVWQTRTSYAQRATGNE